MHWALRILARLRVRNGPLTRPTTIPPTRGDDVPEVVVPAHAKSMNWPHVSPVEAQKAWLKRQIRAAEQLNGGRTPGPLGYGSFDAHIEELKAQLRGLEES